MWCSGQLSLLLSVRSGISSRLELLEICQSIANKGVLKICLIYQTVMVAFGRCSALRSRPVITCLVTLRRWADRMKASRVTVRLLLFTTCWSSFRDSEWRLSARFSNPSSVYTVLFRCAATDHYLTSSSLDCFEGHCAFSCENYCMSDWACLH